MRSNRTSPSFPPASAALALCACLALSACNRAAPAPEGGVADAPHADADAVAETTPPQPEAGADAPLPTPPATTVADAGRPAVCAELERMLTGKTYAAARDALKAAGYRLVPPEAEEGGTGKLAGDPVFCGNQGCTAEYASARVRGLTLTIDSDEGKPQTEWQVGGWDLPECRSAR
jgi:hypothetical protein